MLAAHLAAFNVTFDTDAGGAFVFSGAPSHDADLDGTGDLCDADDDEDGGVQHLALDVVHFLGRQWSLRGFEFHGECGKRGACLRSGE